MRQISPSTCALVLTLLLHQSLAAPTDPNLETDVVVVTPSSQWWPGRWWGYLNGEYGWLSDGASMRDSGGRGWLGHWLSMGGEGSVTIMPASSPPPESTSSPIKIQPIDDSTDPPPGATPPDASWEHPDLACVSPAWPPIRFHLPHRPYLIALVERGGCDFATKIRAAQERGAGAVIVGDAVGRLGETDEEGREREGLITMFSPGAFLFLACRVDVGLMEETEGIYIPSVFVSRSSYLALNDMLRNGTDSSNSAGPGIWLEIGEGSDEGGQVALQLVGDPG